MDLPNNQRILLIDDNPSIHADFRKILGASGSAAAGELDAAAASFFGAPAEAAPAAGAAAAGGGSYEIESALQGEEAFAKVLEARKQGRPYALAFCDVRMPPGWDGVQTLERIWQHEPDLQAVLCTAFSDYSYEQTLARLGRSDRLLILKKPFDPIEVQQLALALTAKWNLVELERLRLRQAQEAEQEARAYAASLETVSRALVTDKATAEAFASERTEMLLKASASLRRPLDSTLHALGGIRTALSSAESADSPLRAVEWATQRSLQMLEQLEELVRLDAGHGDDAQRPMRLAEVLEGAVARAGAWAAARGLRVRLELGALRERQLLLDPVRVEGMVRALLAFAVQESGGEDIRLLCKSTLEGVRLEVHIPRAALAPDELVKVFEPFGRGEGLGLSVAQRQARLFGGDVGVSLEADGLCATLDLPGGMGSALAA